MALSSLSDLVRYHRAEGESPTQLSWESSSPTSVTVGHDISPTRLPASLSDTSQAVRSRPPNPVFQHTLGSATYQHRPTDTVPTQRVPLTRRTQLLWLKETPTMDIQVTYIDEAEGGVVLKWDVTSQLFEGGADLSIGQHSGCLTLNTSDRVFPIAPFLVEHGGPAPQKIIISSGKKRLSNPHMVTDRDNAQTMEETINRLTADLDGRNNELAQQRQVSDRYKQQEVYLSQQMELLNVEIKKLKASEQPATVVPVEIEKLTRQIQESEKKSEMLEREVNKLKEEKLSANNYSDYLYRQKQSFESQLLEVVERFKDSQSQVEKLTAKLDSLTETENAPPPLPTRAKPVSKEKDLQPANGDSQ